ncbi:MAG TPA: hypothetical protein VGI33_16000 [Paenibacillus sp.]|jgi:hypothetical protein
MGFYNKKAIKETLGEVELIADTIGIIKGYFLTQFEEDKNNG